MKGSENVLSGDESAATAAAIAAHSDNPEERKRKLFSKNFSPPFFSFSTRFIPLPIIHGTRIKINCVENPWQKWSILGLIW